MRLTCAAEWARRHSTWMRRRTAPGKHSGAPPSPRGCPVSAGRNERCSSRRSMPIPVNRSCSTATAESTWRTPSPPAVPVAFPTGSGTADTSTAATDPTPRTPIWQPDTHGCWCCHHSAAEHLRRWTGECISHTGRRTPRTRQQSRNDLPGQQLRAHVRRQCDGSVAASARRWSRLRPRQSPRRAAHRILALTPSKSVDSVGVTTPAHVLCRPGRFWLLRSAGLCSQCVLASGRQQGE